jgi:hypothetical protein
LAPALPQFRTFLGPGNPPGSGLFAAVSVCGFGLWFWLLLPERLPLVRRPVGAGWA